MCTRKNNRHSLTRIDSHRQGCCRQSAATRLVLGRGVQMQWNLQQGDMCVMARNECGTRKKKQTDTTCRGDMHPRRSTRRHSSSPFTMAKRLLTLATPASTKNCCDTGCLSVARKKHTAEWRKRAQQHTCWLTILFWWTVRKERSFSSLSAVVTMLALVLP